MTHECSDATLSSDLKVSDQAVDRFDIVAASDVTGFVRIGGNQSARGPNPQQGYAVIGVR